MIPQLQQELKGKSFFCLEQVKGTNLENVECLIASWLWIQKLKIAYNWKWQIYICKFMLLNHNFSSAVQSKRKTIKY